MVKKRVVKRRSKPVLKKKASRKVKRVNSKVSYKKSKPVRRVQVRKTNIKFLKVIQSLFLFILICLISLLLRSASRNLLTFNLFSLLAILSGFISLAFFIVLLVLLFSRLIRRR